MPYRNMGAPLAVLEKKSLHLPIKAGGTPANPETYQLTLGEWQCILAPYPQFAHRVEETDTDTASFADMAQLMRDAPTMVARHVLREAVACRRERSKALGLAVTRSSADQAVFDAAEQEWSDILDGHPLFKRWLGLHDRMACSRDTVIEAMRVAPSIVIRQCMRELFLFRTVTSLYTSISFR